MARKSFDYMAMGGLQGAGQGAAAGAAFGPKGALVGGAFGAGLGLFGGYFGEKADRPFRQMEEERARLGMQMDRMTFQDAQKARRNERDREQQRKRFAGKLGKAFSIRNSFGAV